MAIKANLIIDQGTDYITSINVTDENNVPIDLTGYTGSAQMRKHYTSLTYYSFDVSIPNPLDGEIRIAANSVYTNTIPAGRYVYDCEITDAGDVRTRIIEGIVTITPQVTR